MAPPACARLTHARARIDSPRVREHCARTGENSLPPGATGLLLARGKFEVPARARARIALHALIGPKSQWQSRGHRAERASYDDDDDKTNLQFAKPQGAGAGGCLCIYTLLVSAAADGMTQYVA